MVGPVQAKCWIERFVTLQAGEFGGLVGVMDTYLQALLITVENKGSRVTMLQLLTPIASSTRTMNIPVAPPAIIAVIVKIPGREAFGAYKGTRSTRRRGEVPSSKYTEEGTG